MSLVLFSLEVLIKCLCRCSVNMKQTSLLGHSFSLRLVDWTFGARMMWSNVEQYCHGRLIWLRQEIDIAVFWLKCHSLPLFTVVSLLMHISQLCFFNDPLQKSHFSKRKNSCDYLCMAKLKRKWHYNIVTMWYYELYFNT